LKDVKEKLGLERDAFLRRWISGAQQVDAKAFEMFSHCFQVQAFPRGHVFCQEGECKQRDARRVYVLRRGECRVAAMGETPSFASRTSDKKNKVQVSQPVGLVGEGQMLGYASALFGIPEPFTAVAMSETVEAYWISINERPASSWPREITKPLMALLRMRADYHDQRARSLANIERDMQTRSGGHEITSLGGLKISPWLRNKNTSSQKEKLLSQRFNNWTYDSSRTASQDGRPGSSPQRQKSLPSLHDHEESVGPPSPRRRGMQRPNSSPSIHVPARRSPNLDC
jgi:CRP-like cAMP-binding protein